MAAIRVTVDIQVPLYRQLKEKADVSGRSIDELVLLGARMAVSSTQHPPAKRVQFPLFGSDGPKADLTNEQL
jgi:hypothetical protein